MNFYVEPQWSIRLVEGICAVLKSSTLFLLAGYLAYEFNKFWIQEEPESIMEFNLYREKFHEKVKALLLDPSVTLILRVDSKN